MELNQQLNVIKKSSLTVLQELVTPEGIYASTDYGWKGGFHAWFGRDSAITANLILEAEKIKNNKVLSQKAYSALLSLSKWQGQVNDKLTGEEKGKITHEVRENGSTNAQTQARIKKFSYLWKYDPDDKLLKSWDSSDSTPLWIIVILRHSIDRQIVLPEKFEKHLRFSLEWCLNNLQRFDGWAGFYGADLIPDRGYKGIHNQGWKDGVGTYQYPDGSLAKHPIKDVFVNALFWAAFRYGARYYYSKDNSFSQKLLKTADNLKAQFNSQTNGFLLFDNENKNHFFAEGLDGDGKQLRAICSDVAMCLWAYYENECIIDSQFIPDVVNRIMEPDIFNPNAGLRNYSSKTKSKNYENGYHRGPSTYWPFVSAITIQGFDHFGYKTEAKKICNGMLNGLRKFSSFIELFIEPKPNSFELWHHPVEKQESTRNQAWTAAAAYYVSTYCLANSSVSSR